MNEHHAKCFKCDSGKQKEKKKVVARIKLRVSAQISDVRALRVFSQTCCQRPSRCWESGRPVEPEVNGPGLSEGGRRAGGLSATHPATEESLPLPRTHHTEPARPTSPVALAMGSLV